MITDFECTQTDKDVFLREFAQRLPAKILDNHIHVWSKECIRVPKSEYAVHKQYKPWTDFDFVEELTLEDCSVCLNALFPGKQVSMSCFGLPFPQIDREMNNDYIIKSAAAKKIGFYYMPGQFEDMLAAEKILRMLENQYFIGLKPYPDLVRGGGAAASIYDMFNLSALRFAHENSLTVMLHIPRTNRLRDADNRRELLEIITAYPGIRFILAHAGRCFTYKDVEGTIDFLKGFSNVWFDTALIDDAEVLTYLMRVMNPDRLIYGSDAPLAFTRGKDICINDRHYYVSDHPVPWGISPMRGHRIDLTFYVYEQLRALIRAADAVYGKAAHAALQRIFYDNAVDAMGERGRTVYLPNA